MIKVLILGIALTSCAHQWPSRPPALGDKIVKNIPPADLVHFVGMKKMMDNSAAQQRAWIYENCEERASYVWENLTWMGAYSMYRMALNANQWGAYKINPIGWERSYKMTDDDEDFMEDLKDDSIYWEEMEDLKDEHCD